MRHNESDIMLGHPIGTIYQKVRYVRITPLHFGSWNHESRSEENRETAKRNSINKKGISRRELSTCQMQQKKAYQLDKN